MSHHEPGDHDVYHVTPFPTYIKVYSTLLVFTVITVWAAQVDLGRINTPLAMLIATFKAFLVVWFFMHQKYEGKLNRIIFISGFVFLLIFFGFSWGDIATRTNFKEINFTHDKKIETKKVEETVEHK